MLQLAAVVAGFHLAAEANLTNGQRLHWGIKAADKNQLIFSRHFRASAPVQQMEVGLFGLLSHVVIFCLHAFASTVKKS